MPQQVAQFFPTQNTDQQAQILAVQRQQALAQALQANGQMPDPNEAAAPVGVYQRTVRHSPLEYAVRALSQGLAGQAQQKANAGALKLQAAQFAQALGGGADGSAPNGLTPQNIMRARILSQGDPAVEKAILDQYTPTDSMKNAQYSTGGQSPAQQLLGGEQLQKTGGIVPQIGPNGQIMASPIPGFGNASAMNTLPTDAGKAGITAATTPQTITTPDGKTTTGTVLGNLPGGPSSIPFFPGAQPQAQPSGSALPQVPNGGTAPPPAPVSGTSLPPPAMPNGANPGMSLPVTGQGVPPSALPAGAASPGAGVPPAYVAANGVQVQSPAAAKGAETDATNAETYKSNLIDAVQKGEAQQRVINFENQLLPKFKGGAFTTDRASAANIAQSMGVAPDVVSRIAGGDPAAIQSFNSAMVQRGLIQAKELVDKGVIGQRESLRLTDALANPDMVPGTISYMNNLAQQQYKDNVNELGAMSKWENGDPANGIQPQPLTKFRENYSQQRAKELLTPAPAAPVARTYNPQTGKIE